MKVYLVKQESNVDGEILFNVAPCSSLENAKKVMEIEIATLLADGHYKVSEANSEDFSIEQAENSYYIRDLYDDYYEYITIEEKEIDYGLSKAFS